MVSRLSCRLRSQGSLPSSPASESCRPCGVRWCPSVHVALETVLALEYKLSLSVDVSISVWVWGRVWRRQVLAYASGAAGGVGSPRRWASSGRAPPTPTRTRSHSRTRMSSCCSCRRRCCYLDHHHHHHNHRQLPGYSNPFCCPSTPCRFCSYSYHHHHHHHHHHPALRGAETLSSCWPKKC